jgi:hypothetical protein
MIFTVFLTFINFFFVYAVRTALLHMVNNYLILIKFDTLVREL